MMKSWVIIITGLLILTSVLIMGCRNEGVSSNGPSTASTLNTPVPIKLAFMTQPGGAIAGSPFSTQPAVALQDAGGNPVKGANLPVSLTLTSATGAAGAILYGPATMNAADGTAKFQGLFIDKAGSDYTLTAKSGSLPQVTSSPFTISPGAPFKLVFTQQPADGIAGKPWTKPPEITVKDHYGNKVTNYTGSVTLALPLGSPTGAVLSGTTTVQVVNSIARFTDVSINKSYPDYTLTAMGGSLDTANSLDFGISAGDAVKLEFTAQPGGARAGKEFDDQPVVALEDSFGNVATSDKDAITVSITPGTGIAGAVLAGTKTLPAVDSMGGLSVFSGLSIDRAGSGYQLTAVCGNLTPATSQPFVVSP